MAPDARAEALIITRNFPPLTGGMERLTFHTYKALREQCRCAVVGPVGAGRFIDPETPFAECRLKPLPRFLMEAWIKGSRVARACRPKLIIAASGLVAPIAISIARRFGSDAITVTHGLDLIVPNPLYQRIFVPAIRRSDLVIANSANTARLAQNAGVPAGKIEILHPGVTLPATTAICDGFPDDPEQATPEEVRVIHVPSLDDLKDRRILLSVGRLVPRKGLAEFIDRALPEIVRRDPRVVLLIAGGEATDALKRDAGVLARIQAAVEKRSLHEHVRLLGRITDDAALGVLYRKAHVFIMPLVEQPDDVEGFGMVAVEAAAYGLPTAGFRLGGLPDAVANCRSGVLVAPSDYPALIDAIHELLDESPTRITSATCRAHAEQYAWPRYETQLHEICHRVAPLQCDA